MFSGNCRNSGNHKIGGFSCKRLRKILKVAARDGCWLRGSVAGLSPGLISALLTIAGAESRLSGSNCRNIGKNAKCENELERRLPETVCRVQRCADLRLAITQYRCRCFETLMQVYIFRTPMNQHWCIVN